MEGGRDVLGWSVGNKCGGTAQNSSSNSSAASCRFCNPISAEFLGGAINESFVVDVGRLFDFVGGALRSATSPLRFLQNTFIYWSNAIDAVSAEGWVLWVVTTGLVEADFIMPITAVTVGVLSGGSEIFAFDAAKFSALAALDPRLGEVFSVWRVVVVVKSHGREHVLTFA